MANKNFQNYAVAGNNVALTYDNVGDTVTIDVNVDKNDVGLGNVDNTSDINKPISTLVQNALNLKEGTITAGTTAQYYRGDKTFQTLDKTAVGLSNVDNTTDLLKPISTATQTALNSKQDTITLTTTGSSGASTFAANVLNIPTYSLSGLGGQPLNANLTSVAALTYASTSFVKMTAAGTFALDTATYLTAESDTLASVTGRGASTTTAVTMAKLTLTGAVSGVGNLSSYTVTAATGSAISKQITSTLVASANGDALVGLDISPTFTVGSFTGVTRIPLRMVFGSNYFGVSNIIADGITSLHAAAPTTSNYFIRSNNSNIIFNSPATDDMFFRVANNDRMRLFGSTGNFLIQNGGTFTDAGFRLDVNGTARIQNQLTTTGSITAASAIARGVYMNQTLVAAANGDVLVGLDINPTFTNGAFTVNNYGLRVTGNIVPSADNLYSLGTSPLRFASVNGFQSIFTYYYAPSGQASFFGSSANTSINFPINNTVYARFHATTGNFTLQNGGTFTDAGFRLDVNGTARIQNQLTTTGSITAASAIARGVYMNQTLVAAANGDTLVGLDINPTFTNGAFTGVTNIPLRINGNNSGQGITFVGQNWKILSSGGDITYNGGVGFDFSANVVAPFRFFQGAVNIARFHTTTGNLTLQNGGTFTDAGYRLDVVGADSRFNGIRAGLGAGQVAGNTVFGDTALNSNSAGTGLTAVGYQALRNTTGNQNTGIGYQSGYLISSGTNNTGIGFQTIANTTTSSNNTGVGSGALLFNTSSGNTALGTFAAQNNTTGSNNVAIGYNTVTGNFSGSVILGVSATASANNQFVVGSSTVNAGAVTTATVVQTKTWDVIINGVAQKILLA